MLEKTIETTLKKKVQARRGLCLKLTGYVGIPDRLVLMPGCKIAFIETKAPGKKLRKNQIAMKVRLKRLGFLAYKIDQLEDIDRILDEIQAT